MHCDVTVGIVGDHQPADCSDIRSVGCFARGRRKWEKEPCLVMTKNSYRPFRCERTEATVAAIFAPLLKVGVMTDISGGFMTNRGREGGSIRGEADG